MKRERVSIPCGGISLEGILHLPEGKDVSPGVVVCHPHPLYGGDMENNVVITVCHVLVERSVAALRFNFRGAGASGGSFGGGVREQDDVKAALDYMASRTEIDAERLGLAGYSFGGAVAFAAACGDVRVKRLALVSPALDDAGWEQLKAYSLPKLVLLGEADSVVPFARFRKYFDEGEDFQAIHGVDHFWWGFEEEIGKRIGGFFAGGAGK